MEDWTEIDQIVSWTAPKTCPGIFNWNLSRDQSNSSLGCPRLFFCHVLLEFKQKTIRTSPRLPPPHTWTSLHLSANFNSNRSGSVLSKPRIVSFRFSSKCDHNLIRCHPVPNTHPVMLKWNLHKNYSDIRCCPGLLQTKFLFMSNGDFNRKQSDSILSWPKPLVWNSNRNQLHSILGCPPRISIHFSLQSE